MTKILAIIDILLAFIIGFVLFIFLHAFKVLTIGGQLFYIIAFLATIAELILGIKMIMQPSRKLVIFSLLFLIPLLVCGGAFFLFWFVFRNFN